ncbi:MAG: cyclic nucleotide-binding domain-containing protein [Chloroflexi bacterium]|nr:cyclic nucleotide-binding domain-containing protein [Chloroflexota bacterium]
MSLTAILSHADIFYEMTPSQLELIASICTEKEFSYGDTIFAEHSASDELYVVAEGEVEIQIDPNIIGADKARVSGPQTIATIRRGQSFGEMALLDEGRRSASARCTQGNVQLIVVPRDKLITLCETYPELGYRLMYNVAVDLSMKIRHADLHLREKLLWTPGGQEEE